MYCDNNIGPEGVVPRTYDQESNSNSQNKMFNIFMCLQSRILGPLMYRTRYFYMVAVGHYVRKKRHTYTEEVHRILIVNKNDNLIVCYTP
jgi:hypothetical protein